MNLKTDTETSLNLDYYCQSNLLPVADGCINAVLFWILFFGFYL